MKLPKISVVTVSYNQGEFIKQNIESVLAQNYPNFEHLIIDGGSTDSTLEILKSYLHLKWTSEPDRGQSDALNKGFSKATGEIIAWLNSDDWYAPNIFSEVAQALSDYPVVLGAAEQTDKYGKTTEYVANTPRGYFDLWRYWVPYAWVAQPSVFFRKSLLEEVKRSDGSYIDENLYFTMDFDLWMRIASRYPFTKHINKTLSYFRIYDTNKTGAYPHATQRECSRVFKRYKNRAEPTEQTLSFVIPVESAGDKLKQTVISLVDQNHHDFDITIVGYNQNKQAKKDLQNFCLGLSEAIGHITVRFLSSSGSDILSALNFGVERSVADLVCFLQAGDTLPNNFVLNSIQAFSADVLGLILFGDSDLTTLFYPEKNQLNIAAPLIMPASFPHIIARRQALLEHNGFQYLDNPLKSIKKLLINIIFRNWSINCDPQFIIKTDATNPYENLASSWNDNKTIQLIQEIKDEYAADPFAKVRAAIRNPEVLFGVLPK